MRFFHDENHIRPRHPFSRQRIFRVVVCPRRRAFDASMGSKHLLGRWTAQLVLAANEQNAFHCLGGGVADLRLADDGDIEMQYVFTQA